MIKRIIFLSLFLSICSYVTSQVQINHDNEIARFCKVWGYLKYYHPEIVKGKKDWDFEFVKKFDEFQKIKSKEELNQFYYNWISRLDSKGTDKNKIARKSETNLKYDLNWLTDSSFLDKNVTELLLSIQNGYHFSKTFYARTSSFGLGNVHFTNEKSYPEMEFPDVEYRILTLARYWNIIHYFYPYKFLLNENWDSTLLKFIPKFQNANRISQYHEALLELFSCLNDSHVGINPKLSKSIFSFHHAPFITNIIDNRAVVTAILSDSICRKAGIRFGDVFLRIGNVSVEENLRKLSGYVPASNYEAFCRDMTYNFWKTVPDTISCLIERDGKAMEIILNKSISDEFYFSRLVNQWNNSAKEAYLRKYDNNIGYLNLQRLPYKKIDSALGSIRNTKAVILDLRNYPSNLIQKKLLKNFSNKRSEYVKFSNQDLKSPGSFKWGRTLLCGRNNASNYKGKIVVLINTETQSYAEHLLMALQTIPGLITVGSHTAGANGDRISIQLPGNITTYISGRGVYFPDGRCTQRKGIIPDIFVRQTIKGVINNTDEILEKAVETLNNQL